VLARPDRGAGGGDARLLGWQRQEPDSQGPGQAQDQRGTRGLGGQMNIGDEIQLRSGLGAALDQLEPGPLPLDAVVKRGRTVIIPRGALAAPAVLLVAAAAVAAPKAVHYLGQPPASRLSYHVTVNPPGTGSANRLIASGRVTYSGND